MSVRKITIFGVAAIHLSCTSSFKAGRFSNSAKPSEVDEPVQTENNLPTPLPNPLPPSPNPVATDPLSADQEKPAPLSEKDVIAPTAGQISVVTGVDAAGFTIQWSAAVDDRAETSAIEYIICLASTPSEIETTLGCEEKSGSMVYQAGLLEKSFTGLTPATLYYVNVVARDPAGNKVVFGGTSATTGLGYRTSFLDVTEFPSSMSQSETAYSFDQNVDLGIHTIAAGYDYYWSREATTERGFAFYKRPAVRDSKVKGERLVAQCPANTTNPVVLAANDVVMFLSIDITCDGFVELVKLDVSSGAMTTIDKDFTGLRNGVIFGSQLVFAGQTVAEGFEIWKSDGTDVGTEILHSPAAGTLTTQLSSIAVTSGYVLYGYATGGTLGFGKWTGSGLPTTFTVAGMTYMSNFLAVGDSILFQGRNAAEGYELWKSDGTLGGTVLFKSFYPGASHGSPLMFLLANGNALVFGYSSASETSFITTDGSGITNYTAKIPFNLWVMGVFEFGSSIYLEGRNVVNTKSYRLDLVNDAVELLSSTLTDYYGLSDQALMCHVGDSLYFADPALGLRKVSLDGSVTTTSAPYFLPSGTYFWFMGMQTNYKGLSCSFANPNSLKKIQVAENQQITATATSKGIERTFVTSDQQTDGVFLNDYSESIGGNLRNGKFFDIDGSPTIFGETIYQMGRIGNKLFYNPLSAQKKIYAFDLVTKTSTLVKDMAEFAGLTYVLAGLTFGNQLFLAGSNGLYKTDGTTGGTELVAAVTSISHWTVQGGYLYFRGSTVAQGTGIYRTTGAVGNLTRVSTAAVSGMVAYGTGVIYSQGANLSYYNGSTNVLLTTETQFGSSSIQNLKVVGNLVFYSALNSLGGITYTRYRSPADGTFHNLDDLFNTLGVQFDLREAVVLAGNVYLPANHPVTGNGIWRFNPDFTTATLVKELNNGNSDAGIRYFRLLVDKLFFTSDAGGDGYEVWTSDGTTVGTKPLPEIVIGGSADPEPLNLSSDGRLFVLGNSEVGRAIYLLNLPE